MNRTEIVKQVMSFEDTHGISVDDMVVGYEAAAVMHGMRESSNDIDVDVHSDALDALNKTVVTNRGSSVTGEFVSVDSLDLHIAVHEDDYELIDGIWVVNRMTLLRQYRSMFNHPNRPTDRRKKDLCVIKNLTTKH